MLRRHDAAANRFMNISPNQQKIFSSPICDEDAQRILMNKQLQGWTIDEACDAFATILSVLTEAPPLIRRKYQRRQQRAPGWSALEATMGMLLGSSSIRSTEDQTRVDEMGDQHSSEVMWVIDFAEGGNLSTSSYLRGIPKSVQSLKIKISLDWRSHKSPRNKSIYFVADLQMAALLVPQQLPLCTVI